MSRGLQPWWPDRLATFLSSRRRGGPRARAIRRLLAAALVTVAGVLAVTSTPTTLGTPVVGVAHDLPAGASLAPADLTTVVIPSVPDGALRQVAQALGRLLAAPVRRGEVLTDVRLVSTQGPAPGPGRVAVPVRPADPGTVDLLTPGVHVAVLTVAENGQATVLATDAVVLAIPPPVKSDPTRRLVVLAVPAAAADRVAATGVGGTVVLRFT